MPHKTKKKFIDKKKAVTFQLVHRSQRDPLAADDEAPQHVLMPVSDPVTDRDFSSESVRGRESRLSMLRTHGIAFEDDYDYMQHLREPDQQTAVLVPKDGRILDDGNFLEEFAEEEEVEAAMAGERTAAIRLPSVVFASEREEEVGMLHRAIPPVGPQVEWDPDVVAAMDEDFNFEDLNNIMEDDFVLKAIGGDDECDDGLDESYDDSGGEDFSDSDRAGSWMGEEDRFAGEETRSRFTQYSMTSSVLPRNEHLTLLDDQFEKLYETYDDEKIGDLGQVEIDGSLPVHDVGQEEALKMLLGIKDDRAPDEKREVMLPEGNENESAYAKASPAFEDEEESDDEDDLIEMFKEVPKEKWDCESILSTYSNIYNHPKMIEDLPRRIELSKKTGIPLDTLPTRGLTTKQLRALDQLNEEREESGRVRSTSESTNATSIVSNVRRKGESKEEKAARKKAVKETRRERRSEKKATKVAFRQETTRQNKEYLNLQQNLSGIRIS